MVEKAAFPLAMGWFSRRLAKLLHQGLGYRRAGLGSSLSCRSFWWKVLEERCFAQASEREGTSAYIRPTGGSC